MVSDGSDLRIDIDDRGGETVVRFSGDVDVLDAGRIAAALRDAIDRDRVSVVVDMRPVTFLGSTGVRLMIEADETARRLGTGLSWILGDGPVRRVVAMTGVDAVLDIVDGDETPGHVDLVGLLDRLASLRSSASRPESLEVLLERVAEAGREIFGVAGVALLMRGSDGGLRSVLATDEAGRDLERAQADAGEGPCVEAVIEERRVQTRDLRDDARWPALAARIATGEVRAVIGVPTCIAGAPVGSLNVYRCEPYDWDASDLAAVEAFNRVVESLLAGAIALRRSERIVGELQDALDRRVPIERAVGILMERHGLDAVNAFARLRRVARDQRRRVGDVADEVLGAVGTPPPGSDPGGGSGAHPAHDDGGAAGAS